MCIYIYIYIYYVQYYYRINVEAEVRKLTALQALLYVDVRIYI